MVNPCVTVVEPGCVELREHELPPLGPRQVLIDGCCSLISSGTDLTLASGDFPPGSVWAAYAGYPCRLGYSHVGVVAEVGAEVGDLPVGQRVLSLSSHARWVVAAREAVFTIPDDVTDEQAAWGILGEIALGGVRRAGLTLGESALVLGLGPVGQLTAQLARLDGARPVIAADLVAARCALAERLGAHRGATDAAAAVRELTDDGVDVAFDVTGAPSGVNHAAPLVRRLGRVILLGSPRGPASIDLHDHVHSRSLQLIGAHNSAHPRQADPNHPWTVTRDTALFFALVADGEVRVDELLSDRHPWHAAPAVFASLLADRSQTMGVLLDWQP